MWLYGSGFPKSMNIGLSIDKKNGIKVKSDYIPNMKNNVYGKAMGGGNVEAGHIGQKAQNKWNGWGSQLKPSYEPIIVARKPFKGSLVDNVIENGVGGINIDECRLEYDNENKGRFPANTILTYDETDFDEVCGGFPKDNKGNSNARYFYCAKASKKDRDEGLDEFEQQKVNDGRKKDVNNAFQRGTTLRYNTHCCVKPTELMQYLVRLVSPKGATILDPFMGSGSTGKAVMFENKERQANYKFIGIEREKKYCDIAEARIKWTCREEEQESNENQQDQITFDDLL